MAIRPTWQGHLRLSLVTCPVALYTATEAAGDVHFHLINPETNNRIKMVATDPETGPVERSSLVKGFEIEKDSYILVSDEEIKAVKLESTKIIDIERFVPEDEIDRLYWDHPYYLAPDGKMAEEAFGVIRDAMRESGRIAIGRVVLATRERILAIEPRGKGLLASSLRTRDEVRDDATVFEPIGTAKPDKAMLAIAAKIIDQKAAPFDPAMFEDRYEEALKAMIEAKREGHEIETVEEPAESNVIDLMAALRASLGPAGGRGAKAPAAKSKTRSKPADKPAPKTPAKSAKTATKTQANAARSKPAAKSAPARRKAG